MITQQEGPVSYSIFDPTGNITALVDSPVEAGHRSAAASEIMRLHPEVEQVGFFCVDNGGPALHMAGGEFCGNATMSAAALYVLGEGSEAGYDGAGSVSLTVSGAAEPVAVTLRQEGPEAFSACVRMPRALSVSEMRLTFHGIEASLPLVSMGGISHLVVETSSDFFALKEERTLAEEAVRAFCAGLRADGLGLMFLEEDTSGCRLTPLVYIPGSATVFWENSCASGSAAVGMAMAARAGETVNLTLTEPGGVLRVMSDPAGETLLYGRTRRIGRHTLSRTPL